MLGSGERPPVVDGFASPRWWQWPRVSVWWLRGHWYGVRHARSWRGKAFGAGVLLALGVPAACMAVVVVSGFAAAVRLWSYTGEVWGLVVMVSMVLALSTMLWLPGFVQWLWRRRCYLSRRGDAVIVLRFKDGCLDVCDHLCARPGSGAGKEMRAGLAPLLLDYVDSQGLVVTATAADQKLADAYKSDLPGLVPCGEPDWRGVRLRREPTGV